MNGFISEKFFIFNFLTEKSHWGLYRENIVQPNIRPMPHVEVESARDHKNYYLITVLDYGKCI